MLILHYSLFVQNTMRFRDHSMAIDIVILLEKQDKLHVFQVAQFFMFIWRNSLEVWIHILFMAKMSFSSEGSMHPILESGALLWKRLHFPK